MTGSYPRTASLLRSRTSKPSSKQAGACQFKKKDLEKAQAIVKKVAGDLAETEIIFNPRQLKMMVKLLVGGHALGKVTGQSRFSDSESNTAYIEAVIPEVQGIVRSPVNYEMVHGTIRTIVGGFSLEDPMIMAKTLEELAQTEISDSLAWVSAMKKMADQEDDPKVLTRVISQGQRLNPKGGDRPGTRRKTHSPTGC